MNPDPSPSRGIVFLRATLLLSLAAVALAIVVAGVPGAMILLGLLVATDSVEEMCATDDPVPVQCAYLAALGVILPTIERISTDNPDLAVFTLPFWSIAAYRGLDHAKTPSALGSSLRRLDRPAAVALGIAAGVTVFLLRLNTLAFVPSLLAALLAARRLDAEPSFPGALRDAHLVAFGFTLAVALRFTLGSHRVAAVELAPFLSVALFRRLDHVRYEIRVERATIVGLGGQPGRWYGVAWALTELVARPLRLHGHRWYRRLYGGSWRCLETRCDLRIQWWVPAHEPVPADTRVVATETA